MAIGCPPHHLQAGTNSSAKAEYVHAIASKHAVRICHLWTRMRENEIDISTLKSKVIVFLELRYQLVFVSLISLFATRHMQELVLILYSKYSRSYPHRYQTKQ